jgi:hypothetical protein
VVAPQFGFEVQLLVAAQPSRIIVDVYRRLGFGRENVGAAFGLGEEEERQKQRDQRQT